MSSILKILSVKAERETGEWLVSSLTDIGADENTERRVRPASGGLQRGTADTRGDVRSPEAR